MILALDVGSTNLFGGIIAEGQVLDSFNMRSSKSLSSDELGLFLLQWMQAKDFQPEKVDSVVFCSVVPELSAVVSRCSRDYFNREALTLKAGVKSGIRVRYSNHNDLGGDLISNAVGALKLYPKRDLIILDFGTATTFCGVSKDAEYLGGCLAPGMDIAMEALANHTARLPEVEIQQTPGVCSRDMVAGIQSGIFWGTLGMLKELVHRMKKECFPDAEPLVIATGSYAELYKSFDIFDHHVPELVLLGLEQIRQLNLK